jgi:hypothetical protein
MSRFSTFVTGIFPDCINLFLRLRFRLNFWKNVIMSVWIRIIILLAHWNFLVPAFFLIYSFDEFSIFIWNLNNLRGNLNRSSSHVYKIKQKESLAITYSLLLFLDCKTIFVTYNILFDHLISNLLLGIKFILI